MTENTPTAAPADQTVADIIANAEAEPARPEHPIFMRRTKVQRKKALFKQFSNVPTQQLLAMIRAQGEWIIELQENMNKLGEAHNKVVLLLLATGKKVKDIDDALTAANDTVPTENRTAGGLILPPGVAAPTADPDHAG